MLGRYSGHEQHGFAVQVRVLVARQVTVAVGHHDDCRVGQFVPRQRFQNCSAVALRGRRPGRDGDEVEARVDQPEGLGEPGLIPLVLGYPVAQVPDEFLDRALRGPGEYDEDPRGRPGEGIPAERAVPGQSRPRVGVALAAGRIEAVLHRPGGHDTLVIVSITDDQRRGHGAGEALGKFERLPAKDLSDARNLTLEGRAVQQASHLRVPVLVKPTVIRAEQRPQAPREHVQTAFEHHRPRIDCHLVRRALAQFHLSGPDSGDAADEAALAWIGISPDDEKASQVNARALQCVEIGHDLPPGRDIDHDRDKRVAIAYLSNARVQ